MERKVHLRRPRLEDGAGLHRLISDCPPLDVNSAYLYFLLCDQFRNTCVVADDGDRLLGAITAYVRPDDPDALFIWQVAVHADARGRGLGKRMLTEVAGRDAAASCLRMETTISPSNTASRRLFASWAESRGATLREAPYLEPHHFNPVGETDTHEAECLFQLHPLHPSPHSPPSGESI